MVLLLLLMTPETARLVVSATEIIAQPPVALPVVVHSVFSPASVIVPVQVLAPLTLRRVAFRSRVRDSPMLSDPRTNGSSARVEPFFTVVPFPSPVAPSALLLLIVRVLPPLTSVVPS